MSSKRTFVIIGGGLAGASAAATLREDGFDGRVVARRQRAGASRTTGRRSRRSTSAARSTRRTKLPVHEPTFYRDQEIELRLGDDRRVARRRARARSCSRAASASRSTPRCSRRAPSRAPCRSRAPSSTRVHYLRTHPDSDALAARIAGATHVMVIGAGWIGCEVAASARQLGADGHARRPDPPAAREGARRQLGGVLPRRAPRPRRRPALENARPRGSRAPAPSSASRRPTARTVECDAVVVGIGVDAAHRARARGRDRRRQRRARRRAPADGSSGRLRRGRHRERPEPALRRASHARRALGERPRPGAGRGAGHARLERPLAAGAVLLLRPVRRRHGVRGRPRQRRAHHRARRLASREFIAFWLSRRSPRRRHERQRVGRVGADPDADLERTRSSTTAARRSGRVDRGARRERLSGAPPGAFARPHARVEASVSERAQLLYFTSPRSGPARRVESLLDQVLQERRNHDAFERAVVDVDDDEATAAALRGRRGADDPRRRGRRGEVPDRRPPERGRAARGAVAMAAVDGSGLRLRSRRSQMRADGGGA